MAWTFRRGEAEFKPPPNYSRGESQWISYFSDYRSQDEQSYRGVDDRRSYAYHGQHGRIQFGALSISLVEQQKYFDLFPIPAHVAARSSGDPIFADV